MHDNFDVNAVFVWQILHWNAASFCFSFLTTDLIFLLIYISAPPPPHDCIGGYWYRIACVAVFSAFSFILPLDSNISFSNLSRTTLMSVRPLKWETYLLQSYEITGKFYLCIFWCSRLYLEAWVQKMWERTFARMPLILNYFKFLVLMQNLF
jgi:hypothetical protein